MINFIIPAYNEEKNIERLCQEISSHAEECKWRYKIYIVDDGSTDGTGRIVRMLSKKFPVEMVSNLQNMGPGVAFDKGFKTVLKSGVKDDIIATMEADNTCDLSIFDKMVKNIQSGSDLVLASCYASNGRIEGTTIYRKILSRGANLLVKAVSRHREINTFSSFYRCYSSGILSKAYQVYGDKFIEEKGFACAVDIFLKLEKLSIKISEVPMVLRCHMRIGRSKMKMMKTTVAYLRLFLRRIIRGNAHSG